LVWQGGGMTTNTPAIPLEQRICIEMMVAHIGGEKGNHPLCLGPSCSQYEMCLSLLNDAQKKLKELKK